MPLPVAVLFSTLVVFVSLGRSFILLIFRQLCSPLRYLPGPPAPSFFMGNLEEMHNMENNDLIARWARTYGHTFVYRGFIGGCRLMTTDPVAVGHILGHAYDYPKPDFVRASLADMTAGYHGLVTVEGDDHKRQRKILTPAFSSTHIKSLTSIFWDKATELRDIWLAQVDDATDSAHHNNDVAGRDNSVTRTDVLLWLGRTTLDVIGLAGFDYAFNALKDDSNELAVAFSTIFSTARKFRVMTILQAWFPFLRRFRRNNVTTTQAQATMRRIGLELIDEKRRAADGELEKTMKNKLSEVNGERVRGRDLLSILSGSFVLSLTRYTKRPAVRSNLSTDASQQMSIEEVLCQISTFLAAGHETTSSALSWCLYALAQDCTGVQEKLRATLREVDDALTDAVVRCTYLDWVVRESLRLHAPVTTTMRVCMRDRDEIPLQEGEVLLDKNGNRRLSIPVKKWDIISVPIQAINKSNELWGDDASVFRPERWAAPPQEARAIPGLYSNILTFLNGNPLGGNRACIGYKFALMEIKIFLYVLLKDITFSIDPETIIEKRVNVVTRPFVKSEPHLGNQMPLNISRSSGSGSYP
ncbi:cytochrome P450 [Gymnopilus junonius]|uniref:Cytochrome P450 n=1 Tax=Gymnopilus junonius TaxID=109634 RepID=A0A9P5TRB1_GYMJU|nr:cytochrome P450 [Gymnopilus junonius]